MEKSYSRATAGSDRHFLEQPEFDEPGENRLREAAAYLLSGGDRLAPLSSPPKSPEPVSMVAVAPDAIRKEGDGKSEDSGNKAASELSAPGGGKWTKTEGTWKFFDAKGADKTAEFSGGIKDVRCTGDGSVSVSFEDGSKATIKSDGSRLRLDAKGQVTAVKYSDGTQREFTWEGENLTAVRGRDGVWFDRQKDSASATYIDSWTPRGQVGVWTGTLEADKNSGDYTITASTGDEAGVRVTYRTDSLVEYKKSDGSRNLVFPNKASVSFDSKGRASRFVDEGGRTREFVWGSDDKLVSATEQAPTQPGQSSPLQKWELKDSQWHLNGAKVNTELAVDAKTGVWTTVDKTRGETCSAFPDGRETRKYADGAEINLNHGRIVQSRADQSRFTYEYSPNGALSRVELNKPGQPAQSFKLNEQSWVDGAGKTLGSSFERSERGEPVFVSGSQRIRIAFSGVQHLQLFDEKTKALVESSPGSISTKSSDGKVVRTFSVTKDSPADNPIPVSFRENKSGAVQTWTRQKSGELYTDEWGCEETGASEERRNFKLDPRTGEVSYNLGQSSLTFVGRADGTATIQSPKPKWRIDSKDDLTRQIEYSDGCVRKFGYDDQRQLISVDIAWKDSGGNPLQTRLERVGTDKWKQDDAIRNLHIEVHDGRYQLTELDKDNEKTTRLPDGTCSTEFPAAKKIIDTNNELLTALSIDGKQRAFHRDENGKLVSIIDKPSNTTYERQADGSWSSSKITDKGNIDARLETVGEPIVSDSGHLSFRTKDGSVFVHDLGKDPVKTDERTFLNSQITDCTHLTAEQKSDFKKDLDDFQQRKDVSEAQHRAAFLQINRILEASGEKPFTTAERAMLARQLARHVASPALDAQGAHPTCNVSDIRLSLEREKPELFAKLMADVFTTGEFKTADGHVIKPPAESFSPGAEEKVFPPKPGARTWVGKISDVTLANIFWMRQTQDSAGTVTAKGNIRYEEPRPTGQADSSSRVFRYDQRTDGLYRQRVAKYPGLKMNDMIDIYSQITGQKETGRGLVHNSRTGGPNVTTIASVAELEKALGSGPWPKIVQLQNDVLYGRARDGKNHEHVVVVVSYDSKDRKVLFDNTHQPVHDRLTPGSGVSVDQVYSAMSAAFGHSPDTDEPDGYWQDGMYFQRQKGLEKFNGKTWEPVHIRTR